MLVVRSPLMEIFTTVPYSQRVLQMVPLPSPDPGNRARRTAITMLPTVNAIVDAIRVRIGSEKTSTADILAALITIGGTKTATVDVIGNLINIGDNSNIINIGANATRVNLG